MWEANRGIILTCISVPIIVKLQYYTAAWPTSNFFHSASYSIHYVSFPSSSPSPVYSKFAINTNALYVAKRRIEETQCNRFIFFTCKKRKFSARLDKVNTLLWNFQCWTMKENVFETKRTDSIIQYMSFCGFAYLNNYEATLRSTAWYLRCFHGSGSFEPYGFPFLRCAVRQMSYTVRNVGSIIRPLTLHLYSDSIPAGRCENHIKLAC